MLGKLLKHEFKITSRYFIPMYIAIAVATILLKLSFVFSEGSIFQSYGESSFMDVIQGLLITAYVIVLVGTMIMTVYLLIKRFYVNIFGNEGYLTHTLPVTGAQHLNSKLICAFVWTLLSGPVNLLSFLILFVGTDVFPTVVEVFVELLEQIRILSISGFSVGFIAFELFLLFVISILSSLLSFYLSITLGHHFVSNHPLAGSIAFYFGLSMVSSLVSSIFTVVLEAIFYDSMMSSDVAGIFFMMSSLLGMALFINGLLVVAYYLITKHFLTKKLNLA